MIDGQNAGLDVLPTRISIQTLADHSESDGGKMMIEGEGEADFCSPHHGEARGIDRGKLVKVLALKVLPGVGEIAQIAREDGNDARLMKGLPSGSLPSRRIRPPPSRSFDPNGRLLKTLSFNAAGEQI